MDFQRKILLDQRQHVLDQFQQAVDQWQQVKKTMAENIQATKQAFEDKDKELCKMSNVNPSIELDLIMQQLNYQRAWLDIKLENLEISNGLSVVGERDHFMVQQRALETSFLQEFPILGKKFLRKLRKLLKKHQMTVQSHHDFGARQENGLPKPRLSTLKRAGKVEVRSKEH